MRANSTDAHSNLAHSGLARVGCMEIARENANLGVVGFVEDEASAVTSASGAEITRRELSSLVPPSGPDGAYRMGADIASMCSNIVVVVVLRARVQRTSFGQ
ncbi:predicted protein [Histoplasma capsulatum var. duboisii H88]|uniref:Predicted protein n=2 Tax=Ajellomyces capsulatus TaxID=5037 RepID=F0URP8_AJEC8|nr:predicted protein [Histoplasma capsulatum H143]EGC48575.1 predicted protein [Histoplasma capsulatum var. duboisii H88]